MGENYMSEYKYNYSYYGAYLCNSEKELISCQKHFIKKGYRWNNSNHLNSISYSNGFYYPYFDSYESGKLKKQFPVIIVLKQNSYFGWGLIRDDEFYHNVKNTLQVWNHRKDKLKRLLNYKD